MNRYFVYRCEPCRTIKDELNYALCLLYDSRCKFAKVHIEDIIIDITKEDDLESACLKYIRKRDEIHEY